jgi:hypothetical protein
MYKFTGMVLGGMDLMILVGVMTQKVVLQQ